MRERTTGNPLSIQTKSHIWAFRKIGEYPDDTPYRGKWLIFVEPAAVNALWKRVKLATETGVLGSETKVSCSGLANCSRTKEHLICVYTYDYRDIEDVRRIREALRAIGITHQLTYKSSEDYAFLSRDIDDTNREPKTFTAKELIKYRL